MALIKCTECGKEISSKAKICPHCGAKNKKRTSPSAWIILILALIFAFIYFSNTGTDNRKSSSILQNDQQQIELLNKLIGEGYLRIEAQYNKAYISLDIWNKIDANVKENLSRSLAIYCGNKKGTHLYWVEIYDKMSGKKIAKYSNSWGFTVY